MRNWLAAALCRRMGVEAVAPDPAGKLVETWNAMLDAEAGADAANPSTADVVFGVGPATLSGRGVRLCFDNGTSRCRSNRIA